MSERPFNPDLFTELETPSGARLISSEITLRDLFAAAALYGFVIYTAAGEPVDVAASAYTLADAMLAEREKSDGS